VQDVRPAEVALHLAVHFEAALHYGKIVFMTYVPAQQAAPRLFDSRQQERFDKDIQQRRAHGLLWHSADIGHDHPTRIMEHGQECATGPRNLLGLPRIGHSDFGQDFKNAGRQADDAAMLRELHSTGHALTETAPEVIDPNERLSIGLGQPGVAGHKQPDAIDIRPNIDHRNDLVLKHGDRAKAVHRYVVL
jgi:hypothetical protein